MTEQEKLIESIENHQSEIIRDLERLKELEAADRLSDIEFLHEKQTEILSHLKELKNDE